MYKVLDKINNPQDLKKLNNEEVDILCSEIRDFLIEKVTKNGGHLASNLGIVELTVALHLVYSMPEDKLIWDVGHQSYVHKILTERKDKFDSLRKYKGMSGFPKTRESRYDSFNTGHSSTSASAALGMARARDLLKENYNVAAVFGDGAMTGGMIYEALNDAGHNKTPIVFILNDNEMSISKNVGAISKYLRNLRHKKSYHRSKKVVERALEKVPLVGKSIKNGLKHVKNTIKLSVIPPTFFDDLGIEYLGPVDGHNIGDLISVLTLAKEMNKPVIVHVITQKGHGYKPAENNPQSFHGIPAVDAKKEYKTKYKNYSQCAGAALVSLAEKNEKIVAITAAMPTGVGLMDFYLKYPKRFFDVGIAEQHAVTLAAGLAISGAIPVFAVYSSFLQRSYDQILHDVCLQNLHVVFLVDRAGIVGADGETHHGLYDISYLSDMPGITILSPSSFLQLEKMIEYAVNKHKGPIAIRYPRGNSEYIGKVESIGEETEVINPDGNNVIITSGRMVNTAVKAAVMLKKDGINVKIVKLNKIYPVPQDLFAHLKGAKNIITLEDNTISGGMGTIIGAELAQRGINTGFKICAFPDEPIIHGSIKELDKHYGLDAESLAKKIKELKNA